MLNYQRVNVIMTMYLSAAKMSHAMTAPVFVSGDFVERIERGGFRMGNFGSFQFFGDGEYISMRT